MSEHTICFAPGHRQTMRLLAVLSVAGAVSACAITPQPFSQSEFDAKAAADRTVLFADQEPLDGPLTLPDALARVLKYNLDRRVKMMEEAMALGQLDLDRYDLLPRLAANAGYTSRSEFNATTSKDTVTQALSDANPTYSSDRDLISADLGLTWNILDFGVSWYTANQNADRVLIARERRRKTVANLAQEVRFAFWRAAAAQKLEGRISAAVREAERTLGDAERVEAEGLRDPATALQMQKTLLESIRQLETIQRDLVTAKAELAALINLPPGSDFRLAVPDGSAIAIPVWPHDVEHMETLALANNPDLREQDYQARIAVLETRKEIVRLLPGINFSLSRNYDSNSFLAENQWNEAGAQLTWNLLNVLSAPRRMEHAGAREKVAETKRLALRMAVLAQVHVVAHQFRSATRLYNWSDRLWRLESRLADATRSQRAGGIRTGIERVTRETAAIAAELQRYQAYAHLQSTYGKMQATIGASPIPGQTASSNLSDISTQISARMASFGQDTATTTGTIAEEAVSPTAAGGRASRTDTPDAFNPLSWIAGLFAKLDNGITQSRNHETAPTAEP
ncbi:MAG: TolC family protein [Rhodospirillales bacterium]|nr:TolC family protein [Rhodospirillales bacterium]